MYRFPAVGPLSADNVEEVLGAAVSAPSLHNSQPWRFQLNADSIDLLADVSWALPAADPDRRELVLACGAALFNLRTALLALGRTARVVLLPDPDRPGLLARVTPGEPHRPTPEERELGRAMLFRHTTRRPMSGTGVPATVLESLRLAARREQSWLTPVPTDDLAAFGRLAVTAQRRQWADPAFVAEWTAWTSRPGQSPDGVPLRAGGIRPAPGEPVVVRDFGGVPTAGVFESDPLLLVVASFHDLPLARLQAGQAMQRVLLTATAAGLSTGFVSGPVEVPQTRHELRNLIGGVLWPQTVLRLGYGSPAGPTPRRPLSEVVTLADRSLPRRRS